MLKLQQVYSKDCKIYDNQMTQSNKYYNSLLKHINPEQIENKNQLKLKTEMHNSKLNNFETDLLLKLKKSSGFRELPGFVND